MEPQSPQTKILVLSASPKDLARLRLDHELREIEEGLKGRSRLRDSFQLIPKVAVRPHDVQRALLDHAPQIIHFSGHGEGDTGLALEDDAGKVKFVDVAALSKLFKLFEPAREIVDLRGEGIALVNLGHTQLTLGQYEEAKPTWKLVLPFSKRLATEPMKRRNCCDGRSCTIARGSPM